MREKIVKAASAAVGAVVSFFSGMPPLIWVLVAAMSLDYITGLICGLMGKSPKTEHGGLSSHAAFQGLLKKSLILIVVLLAALIDRAVALGAGVEFAAVTGACCLWFIASEGMSVLENAAAMGVPIPKILSQALELFRGKGGGDQQHDANVNNRQ